MVSEPKVSLWCGQDLPYIEIEDVVLTAVDDFKATVFDKILEYKVMREENEELKIKECGHEAVDQTVQDLHLFEATFFDPPTEQKKGVHEHDEL